MVKLPSLNVILVKASSAFTKFPLTILSSMGAAIVAMYLFQMQPREPDYELINFMLSLILGIPLFFSAAVLIEQKNFKSYKKAIVYAISILLLFLVYLSFPTDQSEAGRAIPYIRYIIFNIVAHLVVSFVPFINSGDYHGFWQYNKYLFIRILEAVLYSVFLYTGLALAMGALEILFDIDIPEKIYFHLFIFIAGFFNTWFFVAGVPKNLDKLSLEREYPTGLKIFTQYILLPLLSIYLLILYSYGIKIIISWNWPEGIVAYLIICVAVVGIFLVLLLFPYQQSAENLWVKRFSRLYYAALAPLVVMLFIAIGIRIDDYGITVNRYLIVLLGAWLTITCAYYLAGRKSIKFIPMSLAIILLLSSFGPWGLFAMSERSQMNRLEAIFQNNQLLKEGIIKNQATWQLDEDHDLILNDSTITNKVILSDSLQTEVKSILTYLDDFHNLERVEPLLKQNLDSLIKVAKANKDQYINRPRIYLEAMGLDYYAASEEGTQFYSYSSAFRNVTDVKGYNFLVDLNVNQNTRFDKSFIIEDSEFSSDLVDNRLIITSDKFKSEISLNPTLSKLHKKYGKKYAGEIDPEIMTLVDQGENYQLKFLVGNVNVENRNGKTQVNSVSGKLLLNLD